MNGFFLILQHLTGKLKMKKFEVTLTRAYSIEVFAHYIESAGRVSEFFIGHPKNESSLKNRLVHNFSIQSISIIDNNTNDINEISNL